MANLEKIVDDLNDLTVLAAQEYLSYRARLNERRKARRARA